MGEFETAHLYREVKSNATVKIFVSGFPIPGAGVDILISAWLPEAAALGKEIGIGIAGGLIVASLGLATRFSKHIYLRFKYPVAGEYISTYEDIEDGKKVMVTSLSKLKQEGRRVKGRTILKNGRTWILEGTIMGTGHISGVYSAESKFDEGVGAFYLRILDSDLNGLWSGYDNTNKIASSGRYIFKRRLPVRTVRADGGYDAAVLSIADKQLGPGYLVSGDLKDSGNVVYVALNSSKVVGFVLGTLSDFKSRTRTKNVHAPLDVAHAEEQGTLGLIKTVAVDGEVQGRGVGDLLFTRMESILEKKGADVVIVPSWKSDKGINLAGILKSNKYDPFLTEPRYWQQECDSQQFHCASRTTACVCDLVWYKKSLK